MQERDHPEGVNSRKVPIVGEIAEVSHHPNADRLYVAKIDVGLEASVSVVFGGSRELNPGDLVPIALPGTHLPNGEKIRPRNYRGVRSYGEILSSDELGWTTDGLDEMLVLPPDKFKTGDILL